MKKAFFIVAATVMTLISSSEAWAQQTVEQRLAALEAKVARYEAILKYLSVNTNVMYGLKGPHVIFTGANVHILSGSGSTDDGMSSVQRPSRRHQPRGLGNLIIGYNENCGAEKVRTGSHNIILGTCHAYSAWGGFVAGFDNEISGQYPTVSGGSRNKATAIAASVSGGTLKTASGANSHLP
jgi:hypothetical protein